MKNKKHDIIKGTVAQLIKSIDWSGSSFYLRLEYAPPYWLMMNFASAGFGFLMFTGY